MACTVNVNSLLGTHSTGGNLNYLGYSSTVNGTYSNTNTPLGFNGTDSSILNFDNAQVGYYKFNYVVGTGVCQFTSTFNVYVSQQPFAGIGTTINVCNNSIVSYNLFNQLINSPQTTGVWSLQYAPPASPLSSVPCGSVPYWVNSCGLSTDDVFNPLNVNPGTYRFTHTVTNINTSGYPVVCSGTDCNNHTTTLIFEVTTAQVQILPNNQIICG